MRQNNKNNRSRNRGNNNGGGRKSPNPLTRSYESNGPDVKVRGTAQHVAEKYMTLARDALASGDTVAAESFFQHAEHYNRIIMTALAQQNAAKEEERRHQQAADNQEQSSSQSERPIVVAGDEPQPSIPNGPEKAASEAVEVKKEDAVNGDEPQKPRRRRAPSRPRRAATGDQESSAPAEVGDKVSAETPDTISENPPAFLMSD